MSLVPTGMGWEYQYRGGARYGRPSVLAGQILIFLGTEGADTVSNEVDACNPSLSGAAENVAAKARSQAWIGGKQHV